MPSKAVLEGPGLDLEKAVPGTRVRSRVEFSGIPKGSTGTIDEAYGWAAFKTRSTPTLSRGVMVCWDPPISRGVTLPQCKRPKNPDDPFDKSGVKGYLRDGFSEDEFVFLEEE